MNRYDGRIDEFCTRHGAVIPVILEIDKVRGPQSSVRNLGYTDDIPNGWLDFL